MNYIKIITKKEVYPEKSGRHFFLLLYKGLEPVYTINQTEISWDKSKNGYRLPTEAEWEYSARALFVCIDER